MVSETQKILLLAIALIFVQQSTASVGCGRQAPSYSPLLGGPKLRIINGQQTKPHSWPWALSFQYNQGQKCGAALLRVKDNVEESDIALTAAHCVHKIVESEKWPKPALLAAFLKPYTVAAGIHQRSTPANGEVRMGIYSYQMHQNYSKMDHLNDLAILQLVKPISFSDTIRPVCLPAKGDPVPVDKTCVAAGWGRIDSADDKTTSDVLQQLVVPVHDQGKCFQKWVRVYHKELMICAGALDGSSSVCNGDSGGPLVCQNKDGSWTQQGVANFVGGAGTCDTKQPPVYARVSMYVDWINAKIQEMSSIK